MDNKELLKNIRSEVTKITSAINHIGRQIGAISSKLGIPREKHNAGISPQEASQQENTTAQGQSTFETQIPPSPSNSWEPENRWYKTMHGWKTLFEIIAIPFAIGYAVVTYCQWRDLQHNFAADERAWIQIQTGDRPKVDESTPFNAWEIEMTNPGKSIALEIHILGRMEIVDKGMPPSFSFPEHHFFRIDNAAFFPGNKSVFPIGFDRFENPRVLSKAESESLLDGNTYLVTYVEAVYRDQFGWHWTRFCDWEGFAAHITAVQSYSCAAWNSVRRWEAIRTLKSTALSRQRRVRHIMVGQVYAVIISLLSIA